MPRYIETQTKDIIGEVMLRPYITQILALDGPGTRALLDHGPIHEIALIYETINRVDIGKKALVIALENWISATLFDVQRKAALEIPTTPLPGHEWLRTVVQVEQRAEELLIRAFHSDPCIKNGLYSAIADYSAESSSSELLALFHDEYLQGAGAQSGLLVESDGNFLRLTLDLLGLREPQIFRADHLASAGLV